MVALLSLYLTSWPFLFLFAFINVQFRAGERAQATHPTSPKLSPPGCPSLAILSQPLTSAGRVSRPFQSHTPTYSLPHRLRAAAVFATLGPLRVTVCTACLAAGAFVAWASAVGLPKSAAVFTPWRRFLRRLLTILCRLYFVFFAYWPGCITVKGKLAPTTEASIVVCNHISLLDGIYLGGTYLFSVVSKVENFSVPLLGCIAVDRSDPKSRERTTKAIRDRADNAHLWPHLLLFPEGTTGNGAELLQFQRGAFNPGLPVQPMLIKHKFKHNDPSYGDEAPPAFTLVLRCLCQVYSHMEIEFLPVYRPSKAEVSDSALYARNVQNLMAEALGVPLSAFAQDDHMLGERAERHYPGPSVGNVGLAALKQSCTLSSSYAKHAMDAFACMDVPRQGVITLPQFTRGLCRPGLHTSTMPYDWYLATVETLFRLFASSTPNMTFRQYLLCCLAVRGQGAGGTGEALALMFAVLRSSAPQSKACRDRVVVWDDVLDAVKASNPVGLDIVGAAVRGAPPTADLDTFKAVLMENPAAWYHARRAVFLQ